MPTAVESRAALPLVTGAAVGAATRLLGSLTGPPESQRADLLDAVPQIIAYYTDGSSALAADFYDDERDRVGARGRFTAEPIVLDRWEKIGRAIAWATQPLIGGDGEAPSSSRRPAPTATRSRPTDAATRQRSDGGESPSRAASSAASSQAAARSTRPTRLGSRRTRTATAPPPLCSEAVTTALRRPSCSTWRASAGHPSRTGSAFAPTSPSTTATETPRTRGLRRR